MIVVKNLTEYPNGCNNLFYVGIIVPRLVYVKDRDLASVQFNVKLDFQFKIMSVLTGFWMTVKWHFTLFRLYLVLLEVQNSENLALRFIASLNSSRFFERLWDNILTSKQKFKIMRHFQSCYKCFQYKHFVDILHACRVANNSEYSCGFIYGGCRHRA